MEGNLLTHIYVHRDSLTRSGKVIADYIIAHSDEVSRMSITQMARECGVGESTIHRFCRLFGQDGYGDFRLTVAECVRDSKAQPMLEWEEINADDPPNVMARKLRSAMQKSIADTCDMLDIPSLMKAAERMRYAKRVVLLGVGDSMIIAFYAYQRLMRSMLNVVCPQTESAQLLTVATLGADDLVVILNDGLVTPREQEMAALCRQKGAHVIGIGASNNLAVARACSQVFYCASGGQEYSTKDINLCCAQSFLIETLCRIYEANHPIANGPYM